MMSEDEYWLIVNAITSISLNFRRTVEVIELMCEHLQLLPWICYQQASAFLQYLFVIF